MSRVLLAWELGAGYGHVSAMRGVALQLRERGHQCVFAVRETAAAENLRLWEIGPVFQAPRATNSGRAVRLQTSYASLLHNTGFDDSAALAARMRAWQTLIRTLAIDAVAINHAPTAQIVARGLGLPRSSFGSSFCVPPPRTPFPWFQPGRKANLDVLERNEAHVLSVINAGIARMGWTGLPALRNMFDDCPQALLSFSELDTYGPGRESSCLGHPDYSHGAPPQWPDQGGPRLLAYLWSSPWLQPFLESLRDSSTCALLRIGGVPPEVLRPYARDGLRIATDDVDLGQAVQDCDLMVHAGQDGAASEALLAGKPVMILPTDVEKVLVTQRLLQQGAGATPPRRDSAAVRRTLDQVIEDSALRANAQKIAARYRGLKRDDILPRAADALTRQL